MKDIASYWINMGKIIGAQGIKGQIKVYSYTRPEKQILNYKTWLLSKKDHEWTSYNQLSKGVVTELVIRNGSVKGNGTLMVSCESLDNRNDAELLRDNYIYVNGADLPSLAADEYYWFQLVGLRVVNLEGYEFGHVQELFDNGANDVMVVSKDVQVEDAESAENEKNNIIKKEVLLPYDMSFIQEINVEDGLITIDWPEEL